MWGPKNNADLLSKFLESKLKNKQEEEFKAPAQGGGEGGR